MRCSRRGFLKSAAGLGALCGLKLAAPMTWAAEPSAARCVLQSGSGYAPFIDAFFKLIRPGSDEFLAEKYAADIEQNLARWKAVLLTAGRDLSPLHHQVADTLQATRFNAAQINAVRTDLPLQSNVVTFTAPQPLARADFFAALTAYLAPFKKIEVAEFQVASIEVVAKEPLHVQTEIRYDLAGRLDERRREERTGAWILTWVLDPAGAWSIQSWTAQNEQRSRLTGSGFVDITAAALGANASYPQQMLHGIDHWRTVLDGASGIDVYGNSGLCVGDFDGDGLDDIYICQPAGLPNRLYKNKGDGTFVDVTEQAGVGILDATSCALFADLTNSGRQDLIVVRTGGPLLFANQGGGVFALKPDAFRFAQPPQGSFTGASLADYNRDGLLDVYFCTYSFYQGLSEYDFPNPYYDAQNGPPNFLLKNNGNYEFQDVTTPSGMDVNNNRFSFAACWNDFDRDGWPDLYVVNDFGRKVLYRNNGNGTFTDVSVEAGVEDPGEGMSMTWLDYDNDGRDDMYVVNMWESAGRRVTAQPEFMPGIPEPIRRIYSLDASGNSLLHNEGNSGHFQDVTDSSGTKFGGWNWGSDAFDFDQDGFPDLYVANGFISGRNREDLSSFYWRHIAARSLDAGGRSKPYADAWSAINEFIRSDYTWSGYQRNNLYLNNRNATFTEAAGLLGLDCLEDSRAFALSDLDGDGRLEIVIRNRTAPQVRIFHNQLDLPGASLSFSLRGTTSNRDAIGAVVELETAHGKQRRTVRAGSGFLSQNSKVLHFGLGAQPGVVHATVEWPGGGRQALENIPPDHRIEVVEGVAGFHAVPFHLLRQHPPAAAATAETPAESHATWMIEPILPPGLALQDHAGNQHSLAENTGSLQLLVFAATGCETSAAFLRALDSSRAVFHQAGIKTLAVLPNATTSAPPAPAYSFPLLLGDEKIANIFAIFHRYLFDRRREMAFPTSFLLDKEGKVVRVYAGTASPAAIAHDAATIPATSEERMRKAFPFPGRFYRGELHHNYFTYGVGYLQYEYLDEALAAFQQAILRNQSVPAAYYNLGLIYLNKEMFDQARSHLEKAVQLDPANADAWNNLGVVVGQLGDYAGAKADFQRALDRQPTHLLAIQNMVKLLQFQQRPDEARALLLKAIEADPRQAEFHRGLGMFYVEQKDLASAENEFQKAVALQPGNPEILNGLGVVFMQEGKSAEALDTFDRCRKLAPNFDRPYLNMAVLYLSSGHAAEAHAILAEYLARDPSNQEIRQALQEVDSRQ